MTFSFAQRVSGREVSGKCVAQTEKDRRKPACTRTVTAGTLSFTGHSGTNNVAFQGAHLGRNEAQAGELRPCDYGHQLCRSALCAEVAELYDREVTLGGRARLVIAHPLSPHRGTRPRACRVSAVDDRCRR